MFLIGFPAAAFGTNCFIVASAPGQECLIIDPGIGVVDRLAEVLADQRLTPVGLLLTHGHLDHTYSVTPVCESHGLTARIHDDDVYRLDNPIDQLGNELRGMLVAEFGPQLGWTPPHEVAPFADGARISLGGLDITVHHAPGHTEGSVLFAIDDVPDGLPADSGLTRTVFAGDVLFAGGIGRTDLPGGDDATMRATLRDVVLAQSDDTLVFPGHGPATTIGRERAMNPYLQYLG